MSVAAVSRPGKLPSFHPTYHRRRPSLARGPMRTRTGLSLRLRPGTTVTGLISWSWEPPDDGKFAIVGFAAKEKAAPKTIAADSRVLKSCEKGKAKLEDVTRLRFFWHGPEESGFGGSRRTAPLSGAMGMLGRV